MKSLIKKESVSRAFNKTMFSLKKKSPEILAIAGAFGAVVSTVMACKATTKLSGILEEANNEIDQIHEYMENDELPEDKYSENDGKKDLAIVYTQTAVKVVKLYAPAVILGAVSITSMLASNNILRKRNMALAAAYASLDKSFKDYRSRLIEKEGEAVDKELKYNLKSKEVEETVVDENGEERVEKKTIEVSGVDGYSEYARFFDSSCKAWEEVPEYNLTFLTAQQRYANDLLRSKGFLTLNTVYEMLGFEPTRAGMVVGWVYDEKNPVGDNYVDFGIFNINREKNRDFVNGYEPVILLDFNVDGNIYDRI